MHNMIRSSIVVSISACHAEDPGSIPGGGDILGASRSLWCVETQQQCVELEQLHESDTYVVGCLRELSGVRGRSKCLKSKSYRRNMQGAMAQWQRV